MKSLYERVVWTVIVLNPWIAPTSLHAQQDVVKVAGSAVSYRGLPVEVH